MENKVDDTKLIIANSFIELLDKKSLDKITIKDIVDNCYFSRQTFYRHFPSIYDLINWIHDYLNAELIDWFWNIQDIEQNLTDHFILINKNKKFYINAFHESSFKSYYYNDNFQLCLKYIGKKYLSEENIFSLKFFWHGVTNILEEWLNGKINLSPQKLAQYICKCFPKELEPYYFKNLK